MAKSIKTIGVLVIDVRTNHFANTAYALEQELYKLGYNVLLCNTGGSMDNETCLKEDLKKIPIVMANGRLDIPNVYSVLVDDELGIQLAVEHLYKCSPF